MNQLSEFLLHMTIGSCVTAGGILLVRLLFGKILSARSKYLLWMLLAIRLCMPILPYSPWSVYHIPAQLMLEEKQQEYVAEYRQEGSAYTTPTPLPSEQGTTIPAPGAVDSTLAEEVARQSNLYEVRKIPYTVYKIGAASFLIGYVLLRIKNGQRLIKATRVTDEDALAVFRSVRGELGITGDIALRYGSEPMIGGIRNPVLLIPRELQGDELRTALIHELLHYKNGDLQIAAVQHILCCIYWFNPVVWLCFRQARKDCELACDQQILQLGYAEKTEYAKLLLREGEMKRKAYIGTTAFGASDLKQRIKAITRFKKPGKWMAVVAVLLVLVISVLTMTGDSLQNINRMVTPEVRLDADTEIIFTEAGQTYSIDYAIKPSNAELRFLSNNPDVAYADGEGTITAVGPGACEITVKSGYQIGDTFESKETVETIKVNCDFPEVTDLSPAGYPLSTWMDFTSEELTAAYLGKNDKTPTQVIREDLGEYLTEAFINSFETHPISEFLRFGNTHHFHSSYMSLAVREKEFNDGVELNDYDFTISVVYENSAIEDQSLTLTGTVYCNAEDLVEDIYVDELALREFYDRFDPAVKETYALTGQQTAYQFDGNLEMIRSVDVEIDGIYYDREEGTDTFYGEVIFQNWPEEGENSGGRLEIPEFYAARNGFTSGILFYYGQGKYKSLGQIFISFEDGVQRPKLLIALEDGTYIGNPGETEQARKMLMDELFGVW